MNPNKNYGKLFLIPTPIVECEDPFVFMPLYNRDIIISLDYFIVEELRTARRFISKCKTGKVIDSMIFTELNEHTEETEVEKMIKPILEGVNAGVMSEAGVPGVADPGALVVASAHRHNIEVIPLIGPSSILMSLMASGMNGQSFTFNGYLPVKPDEKARKLREIEKRALTLSQTQIFIETPYRNGKLFDDMLSTLSANTKLCVASNISAENQFIKTATISEWKRSSKPDIQKIPTIFLIG